MVRYFNRGQKPSHMKLNTLIEELVCSARLSDGATKGSKSFSFQFDEVIQLAFSVLNVIRVKFHIAVSRVYQLRRS